MERGKVQRVRERYEKNECCVITNNRKVTKASNRRHTEGNHLLSCLKHWILCFLYGRETTAEMEKRKWVLRMWLIKSCDAQLQGGDLLLNVAAAPAGMSLRGGEHWHFLTLTGDRTETTAHFSAQKKVTGTFSDCAPALQHGGDLPPADIIHSWRDFLHVLL